MPSAEEGLLRVRPVWSGELGQVVGTLNTLFRVRGPCLVFTAPTSPPVRHSIGRQRGLGELVTNYGCSTKSP